MIRKAVPADIPDITALGIEALERGAYERMLISRQKVEVMALECVSSANNFAWVCEVDGKLRGAVVALVHECMFYERKQATCLMFWCHEKGEGVRLIREFLAWARARPVIKMIVFSLEHDADPRIATLLTRLGLTKALPAFIETR